MRVSIRLIFVSYPKGVLGSLRAMDYHAFKVKEKNCYHCFRMLTGYMTWEAPGNPRKPRQHLTPFRLLSPALKSLLLELLFHLRRWVCVLRQGSGDSLRRITEGITRVTGPARRSQESSKGAARIESGHSPLTLWSYLPLVVPGYSPVTVHSLRKRRGTCITFHKSHKQMVFESSSTLGLISLF